MSLRIYLVSAVVAAAAAASGCGGNGSGTTGTMDSAGSTGGQYANCANDKVAIPFSAGMKATSMDKSMTVSLDSDPPMPVVSDHSTWMMTITDGSGAPVAAGTTVSVRCLMSHSNIPSHGCPANISVKEMGNGVYEAKPVIFNMPGHWTVTVTVDTTLVPFELCIE